MMRLMIHTTLAPNTLYVVGLPIGNDADITLRAIATLKAAQVIAAEDTRKVQRLFALHGIQPQKLIAHHNQNEKTSAEGIVALLQQNLTVALVSDAGMPCVSDPGSLLVKTLRCKGFAVEVVPGVSAATTAVAASGLVPGGFVFVGFVPRKVGDRQRLFRRLALFPEALVFYESPRRVFATLQAMAEVFGPERLVFVGRELTKIHQEMLLLTLGELINNFKNRTEILGEFVIVIEGATKLKNTGAVQSQEGVVDNDVAAPSSDMLRRQIYVLLESGLSVRDVRNRVVQETGLPKKDVYRLVLLVQQQAE